MKKKRSGVFPGGESILKIIRVMKLVGFLLLACFLKVSANSYSQTAYIKLSLQNISLGDALKEIQKQTEFTFFYSVEDIKDVKVPKVEFEKATLEEALDLCLKGTDLSYEIAHKGVIIRKNEKPESEVFPTKEVIEQKNSVKGKVSDSEGHPLPGVTITIVGTTRGVITDNDGTYSIEAEPRDKLVFSFIGMESQIVDVGAQKVINIKLKDKSQELEDVTVVAFGKQKKESVISSISTVKPSELKIPSSNLTAALAGRVAGLISYQRSGEPGQDDADFFIRGVTTFGYKVDPLILIDNVEVTTADLSRLQTDDIGSFSIMKDAAATALYGARGANGVILVTTKSGIEGKAKISFRVENSVSTPTQNVELADPITYMRLHNESVLTRNPQITLPYSQQKIDNTKAGVNPYVYPATDWRSELFEDYAMNQRYNLNVSGGGQVARYYVAGSITKDRGVLKVDGMNNFNNNINLTKYTLRSNVDVNITRLTELTIRMTGNFDDYTGPIHGGSEMYRMVMRTNPVFFPAYYPADKNPNPLARHIAFGNYDKGDYINPYAEMVKGYKDYSRSMMLAQLELDQELSFITEGLAFRALMNTSRNSYFAISRSYLPFYYGISSYNRLEDEYTLYQINESGGREYLDYSESPKEVSSIFYLESAISYDKIFQKKHGVSGMLVYTMRQSLAANAGSLQLSLPSRNIGLSGRATYSFSDRYFAEFNFGYNGSERFHESKRFGFFPSAGLAWTISNEQFWQPYKNIVSNLRLRGTYGLVGNDAIGSSKDRFFYLSNVDMDGTGAVFGKDNGYSRQGVSLTRYSNEDISWETSRKMNLALDMGLFDALQIQAEYYSEYRTNILMTRSYIPSTMGLTAPIKANVGEASGKGWDISVDYFHYFGKDLWVQGRGNFTYSTSRYEVFEEPEYDDWWRSRIGYSIQQPWGYIAERLFVDDYEVANSPKQNFGEYMGGDIKFRDVNNDGQITEADKVPIGYPTIPEIAYGFGLSTGFKNWDFSVFFNGVARESFMIDVSATAPFIDNDGTESVVSQNQLLKVYADDHWSEDNRNVFALWPRLSHTLNDNNAQSSTWFQQNGSFLRLKQLEIGYSMPGIAKKINVKSIRIYVSGVNIMTWSKFKLWDVEMASDGLGYPIQKVYNVGLHLSF